jgi:hypothetical protein
LGNREHASGGECRELVAQRKAADSLDRDGALRRPKFRSAVVETGRRSAASLPFTDEATAVTFFRSCRKAGFFLFYSSPRRLLSFRLNPRLAAR